MSQNIVTISKADFFKIISRRYPVPVADKKIALFRRAKTSLSEQKILYRTVKRIKPKIMLEIGTHYGQLTLGLFINSVCADVYTIDICKEWKIDVPFFQDEEVLPKGEVGKLFKNKVSAIHQIFGDSRNIDTYSVFKNKPIDFAFIDGNHSFEAVVEDTRNVMKFIKGNSIIFWHDFNDNESIGVKAALNSLAHSERLRIHHIDKTSLAFSIL